MRQENLKEFKLGMKKQQFMFTKVSQESEAAVHASYVLSEMIAKHSKPFTEGDFIKECLIKAAEIVCPGSVKTFQAIYLSRNTVVERVTDMARNLNDQIKEKSSCFEAFSIACDESLSYYTEVRWLSCSKVLKQFWDLKEEICQFLINKNQDITLFSDQVWLQDFSFMVDITKHLSDLNLKLQGKDQIITNMCDQVNAFKCETASYQKYAEKILSLRNEFETRFSDFKSLEGKFTLFSSIFSINIESVPNHMQMEVIDIQCDSDLKAKFIEVGVSEFYKYLPARFENTRKLAYEIMSMFGSTYRCEQLFSLMKGNKSPIRSRITDVHLGTHPAYSPDLVPSDNFFFGLLKKELKGKRFDSDEDVQKVVQDFFHTLPKSAYKEGIYKLPERWRRCIESQGYERVANHNQWDETLCLANVYFYLTGTALEWFENNKESILTWTEFMLQLENVFGKKESSRL
ncbi:GTF2IRD2 [Cordylochernes scorpioides]|uniref:GTF2IRD2 n=1 Tax=Cordylochernes scorpioides TaxID=51811 RepID=A0ABY6L1C7_9ARAC|nr:GTF2IRD2 [Cordylochernes scorpioides]